MQSLPSCLQPPLLPISGRVGDAEGKGAPRRHPARTFSAPGLGVLRDQAAVREAQAVDVQPCVHEHAGHLDAETSAATLTLFLVALWALAIVARPYTWWRILLVAAMGGAFAVVLVVPFLQGFFQLELVGGRAPGLAVGIAAAAGLLLDVALPLGQRVGAAFTPARIMASSSASSTRITRPTVPGPERR